MENWGGGEGTQVHPWCAHNMRAHQPPCFCACLSKTRCPLPSAPLRTFTWISKTRTLKKKSTKHKTCQAENRKGGQLLSWINIGALRTSTRSSSVMISYSPENKPACGVSRLFSKRVLGEKNTVLLHPWCNGPCASGNNGHLPHILLGRVDEIIVGPSQLCQVIRDAFGPCFSFSFPWCNANIHF